VKLAGVLVHASICLPRAHGHAIWLLPWVEALLSGRSVDDLVTSPPWPRPTDPLLSRHLLHTLIDLRWVTPVWSSTGVVVDKDLERAFRTEGRLGLARVLFDAEVIQGEWWAEGLSGTVLSRATASAFDWDRQKRADHDLDLAGNPQTLVDRADHDLADLFMKLGRSEDLRAHRDNAFLASPLTVGDPKDILFTMVGDDLKLLPAELAELEPVLASHAPELFGRRKVVTSRIVQLKDSPVERIAAELERLPADPVALGPIEPVRARVTRLEELVARSSEGLAEWLATGLDARPVLGPTQVHFDALAEVCAELPKDGRSLILLTTAFLNPSNAAEAEGIADAFAIAPSDARFLIVYGHANDDLPDQQARDIEAWKAAVVARAPSLRGRVFATTGKRRSHEKVLVTSTGDWQVGSWNAGSSLPSATVFECSLAGRSTAFAAQLLDRIRSNVEEPFAASLVDEVSVALPRAADETPRRAREAVEGLVRAVALLKRAIPDVDGSRSDAWTATVRAARTTLLPFLSVLHADVVDEHQTRDAFLALLRGARRDVLLASDRLADSGLDPATLRDLHGGRSRRTVRVVWGREWAGRRPTDNATREQLERARGTVRRARDLLGPALLTREDPMENHAKLLVVDGMRGIVTSENLLSYGGEKGRYESRELGLVFWSTSVARHIVGKFRAQWPGALERGAFEGQPDAPLGWIVTGNELWHSLHAIRHELEFEWRAPEYLEAVMHDELAHTPSDEERRARIEAWRRLEARVGTEPFPWLREEGERLGVCSADPAGHWCPYDVLVGTPTMLATAEALVEKLPSPRQASLGSVAPVSGVHPLVQRVLDTLVEIRAGAFLMGDDRVPEERPRHCVTISRPFLLARTPATQDLWRSVMGGLPHLRDVERHPEFPIIHVSYREMQEFLDKLNGLPGGGGFQLPTEAQWEYACRAGSDATYCFGDDPGIGSRPGRLEEFAWTKRNSDGRLHPVGQRRPNAFGLFDMHGLVYETMRDGPRPYTPASAIDPIGLVGGDRVVARGGYVGRFPIDGRHPIQEHFRCASRQIYEKSHRVSFRIARRIDGGAS